MVDKEGRPIHHSAVRWLHRSATASGRTAFFLSEDTRFQLYLALHSVNAAMLLVQGLLDQRPHAIYRAGLQTLDCCALLFVVLSRRFAHNSARNPELSFGASRVYVLAGFLLAIVVLLDGVLRIVHAAELFLWGAEPNEPRRLVQASSCEAVIGLVGIFMFANIGNRKTRWPRDDMNEGAFLHSTAECMYGLAITSAALLSSQLDTRARLAAVSSAIAAAVSAKMAIPLIEKTGLTLLHATPPEQALAISTRLRDAATVDGVLEVCDVHFWEQAPGLLVGDLRVMIKSNADEQVVLGRVLESFEDLLDDLTVQVDRVERSVSTDRAWLERTSTM